MIGQLIGIPQPLSPDSIILNVRGVGYLVFCPPQLIAQLIKKPQKTLLFIHTHVREDALELYGFISITDLHLFKLLINISGIGPKTAVLVLDQGADSITQAVAQADLEFFQHVPRLGKKSAQKIIIELKPKLGDLQDLDLLNDNQSFTQAVKALIGLGFSKQEAREALKASSRSTDDLDDRIKSAIIFLGKNK